MRDHRYILSIPVDRGHTITVISNLPMRSQHFAKLDEYLALQKEIFTEAGCDSDRNGEAAETVGLSPEGESAGLEEASPK